MWAKIVRAIAEGKSLNKTAKAFSTRLPSQLVPNIYYELMAEVLLWQMIFLETLDNDLQSWTKHNVEKGMQKCCKYLCSSI